MKMVKKWLPAIPALLLIVLLTWAIVLKQMGIPVTDIVWHVNCATEMPSFEKLGSLVPYPLFHIGVRLMDRVLPFDISIDVALFLSLINIVVYGVLYHLWYSTVKEKAIIYQGWLAAMVLIFLIIQPIYIASFNSRLYLGQGSINIWHNPTYMLVKPFAILAFVLVCRMLSADSMEKKLIFTSQWWKLLVVIIFCNLGKPAFSQVFIPGLGLYMIVDILKTRGKSFLYHLQIATAFIPGTIILFAQALASLGGGVALNWMKVWKLYTKSPLFSMVLLMAFPICLLCMEYKTIFKDSAIKLSLSVFFVGFLEAALLVENGGGERGTSWTHGNFFWGYYLGALIVWIAIFPHFLRLHSCWFEEKKGGLKLVFSWIILLLHIISGCWYIQKFLMEPGFWY